MYGSPIPVGMRTPSGLKWAVIAFVAYMIALGLQLALSIVTYNVLAGIGSMTPGEALAALAGVLALTIVFIIVVLIVFILYSIGFGYLYAGRAEFGPAHTRDVRTALYLFIAAIGTWVVEFVATIVITFQAIDITSPNPVLDPAALNTIAVIAVVFGVGISALVAGILVLSVRRLAEPRHLLLLYAAGILGIVVSIVVGALTLWQLPQLGTGLDIDPGAGIPGVVGSGLGFLTFVLYLLVYRGAAQRIRSGALPPTMPPPRPWMAQPWPAPPVAPPPPPTAPPAAP